MFKKYCSIFMISLALAMLLGLNVVVHHHHDHGDGEHVVYGHSHSDDHSNDHHHNHDHESDHEGHFGLFHFLYHLPLHCDIITMVNSDKIAKAQFKPLPLSTIVQSLPSATPLLELFVQSDLHFNVDHLRSKYYLPSGLRAPPVFFV